MSFKKRSGGKKNVRVELSTGSDEVSGKMPRLISI